MLNDGSIDKINIDRTIDRMFGGIDRMMAVTIIYRLTDRPTDWMIYIMIHRFIDRYSERLKDR